MPSLRAQVEHNKLNEDGEMNIESALEELANRGQGLTIDFRRSDTNWPNPWRLTLYSSKKHKTVDYFDSFDSLQSYIFELIK